MYRFKTNTEFFTASGFEVMDQQMPDPQVGIFQGYVILKDHNGDEHELDWFDALDLVDANADIGEINAVITANS